MRNFDVKLRRMSEFKQTATTSRYLVCGGGGAELGGGRFDVALPVLAGEHRAATLTPVGCRRGEPR
jgi:hypothetical protein